MKSSIEVTIGGQRYVLKSEGDPEQLRHLADLVNGKLEEVRQVTRSLSPERLAVLTALNIADELIRERRRARALREEIRRRAQRLLGHLRALMAQEAVRESEQDVG